MSKQQTMTGIRVSAVTAYRFPSSTHPSWVYAAGGVTSTAADMNRFNQALLSDLFGFGAVESFDRSAAGVTSFGMESGVSSGDLRFTHAGGLDTYTSYSAIFRADRCSVVVLCNFFGPVCRTSSWGLAASAASCLAAK
jgi:CubicO group peptidase (beta-lactamase class C family)